MNALLFRFVFYFVSFAAFRLFTNDLKSATSPLSLMNNLLLATVLTLIAEFLMVRFLPFLAGNRLAFSSPCGVPRQYLKRKILAQQLYVLLFDTLACFGLIQAANDLKILEGQQAVSLYVQSALLLTVLFLDGTVSRSTSSAAILKHAEANAVNPGELYASCASRQAAK